MSFFQKEKVSDSQELTDEYYDFIFKFTVVGDATVGKSSLLRRFIDNEFEKDYNYTIGVEFFHKIIPVSFNGTTYRIKLYIFDTAGQQTFRSITKTYYRGACALIIVFDKSRKITFKHAKDWLTGIRESCPECITIFLAGNKKDLDHFDQQVTWEEGLNFATGNDLFFLETSGKTGHNVKELFESVTRETLRRLSEGTIPENEYTEYGIKQMNDSIRLSKEEKDPGSFCCN